MIGLRIPLWLLACLTLALGSLGGGHARGASPATGFVTLCLSGATVTVAVDAQGQPVSHSPLCPDCLGVALIALPGHEAPAHEPRPASADPMGSGVGTLSHPAPLPPVRAPPQAS